MTTSTSDFVVVKASTGPKVKETADTLGGAPIIRVDGFPFVGESDVRAADPHLTRWASERKTNFIYKGRFYTRIDHTLAFVEYFGLKAYTLAEHGSYVPLSEATSVQDKG